tara:strand:- start:18885 stop:20258 length:1374 start_codon:yes stop_codon:yes gene_type:complete
MSLSDTNVIASDVQSLFLKNNEGLITLFELVLVSTAGANQTFYFHGEKSPEDITFDGNTYLSFPLSLEGINTTSQGPSNRPTLTIPNVETVLKNNSKLDIATGTSSDAQQNNFQVEDLLNKRITRRRTLQKYVGIGSNSPEASGNFEFPKAVYIIDRIAEKTSLSISVELASPFELEGFSIPSRLVTGKYCPWVYKGYDITSSTPPDVKSGCWWKTNNKSYAAGIIVYNNANNLQTTSSGRTKVHITFTADNEPLIYSSFITSDRVPNWRSSGPTGSEPKKQSGINATYSAGYLVQYNNEIWQARRDVNVTTPPFENSPSWILCRVFNDWDSTGGTPYTVNIDDSRKNSYVCYNGEIYRAIRNSGQNSSFPSMRPDINPNFWEIAETCGKTIESCKYRYQAIPFEKPTKSDGSVQDNWPVIDIYVDKDGFNRAYSAQSLDTQGILAFGGFPGTRRLR